MNSIADIPKAELHFHLEGALHLPTLWEFSQRHQPGRYASFQAFKAAATVPKGSTPGFIPFLAKFDALRFRYGTFDDIADLVYHSTYQPIVDNGYCEFRFSPIFFARRTLDPESAHYQQPPSALVAEAAEAVIAGARKAEKNPGGRCEFILTCARDFGYIGNKPALDLIHRPIGAQFKGLDLAGNECLDATQFVPAFREWKEAGKMITIHAGEDISAKGPANIVEALDVFKADRIGHGVRAIEDSHLVARLADEGIPLEICPTSNVQTRSVSSEERHPMKRLFDAGVRVTINTDDPTICGTSILDEYAFASRLGFSVDELMQCTINALQGSMLPTKEKVEFIKIYRDYYERWKRDQRR